MFSYEVEAGLKKAQAEIISESELNEIEQTADCDLIEINADISMGKILTKDGYFYRPRKVTYKLVIPSNEEEYISSLGRNKRKGILRALKTCRNAGIEIRTEEPIANKTFLEWEKIYDDNISKKKIGLKRIGIRRFKEVQPRTAGVFAYKNGNLIGGILLRHKKFLMHGEPNHKLSISLSSSDSKYFLYGVNEALNFEVIKYCQKNKIKFLERGMDSNLYGHYLNPGLYTFKKSLGYRIASRPKYGYCWTKIINFEKFDDHIFFVAQTKSELEGILIFKKTLPNVKEYKSQHLKKLKVFMVIDNKLVPFSIKQTVKIK